MSAAPWILISILTLLMLLLIVWIYAKKKYNRSVDYYNLFLIGMFWTVIGLPLNYSELSIIGIVLMIIGLVNKNKWKKNKRRWKDLSKKERKLIILITIILTALVLISFVILLLAKKGMI